MKKILITGSNGLLGQKIVNALIQSNYPKENIIATSKGENRITSQTEFTYHPLDITNKDEVEALVQKTNPDVIINTAALTNVDACETEKELCDQLNIKAVEYLVEVCLKQDIHLIHLSTDFVFDGEKGNYVEGDKPNPLSYYGRSKAISEEVVINSGLKKWSVARTIIVYGTGDQLSRSNIILWAKQALEEGKQINIVDDQFRSPTLAEDLAVGCIAIAEKEKTGIYHLSGPETLSIYNLVKKVAAFWKLDADLIHPIKSDTLNQAAKRPPKTGFNITKAEKELNYHPKDILAGLLFLDKQLKD